MSIIRHLGLPQAHRLHLTELGYVVVNMRLMWGAVQGDHGIQCIHLEEVLMQPERWISTVIENGSL